MGLTECDEEGNLKFPSQNLHEAPGIDVQQPPNKRIRLASASDDIDITTEHVTGGLQQGEKRGADRIVDGNTNNSPVLLSAEPVGRNNKSSSALTVPTSKVLVAKVPVSKRPRLKSDQLPELPMMGLTEAGRDQYMCCALMP